MSIKARMENGKYLIGIDATNVRLLKEGKPMRLDLRELGVEAEIALVYADTLDELFEILELVTGQKLPREADLQKNRTYTASDFPP